MSKLTPRQKRFITEYLVDFNGAQAARRAGYSPKSANREAVRLLSKATIKNAIKEKREEIQNENIATAKDVEEFLSKAMLGEVDEEVLLNVFTGDGVSEVTSHRRELSGKDRLKAANLLGKRYALFTEKVEVNATEEVELKIDWGEPDEDV